MIEKYKGNPILRPDPKESWARAAVFNPAVCLKDGTIHLFPRGIGEYDHYISRIGHYVSRDGIKFQPLNQGPVLGPGREYDSWGCEDPRATKIGDAYYFTYVAVSQPVKKGGGIPLATALASTKDFKKFKRHGVITPKLSNNKDVVLFPEKIDGAYAMLHRPSWWCKEWFTGSKKALKNKVAAQIPEGYKKYKELPDKPSIWIAFSKDLKNWTDHKVVMEPKEKWEEKKIGAGPPPIKTEAGWLIIYHGVSKNKWYRAGAALLDLDDPAKVIARTRYPILEPEEDYERKGDVENVVFPTGSVVIGDELYLYYGAADKYVALATCPLQRLLDLLLT